MFFWKCKPCVSELNKQQTVMTMEKKKRKTSYLSLRFSFEAISTLHTSIVRLLFLPTRHFKTAQDISLGPLLELRT